MWRLKSHSIAMVLLALGCSEAEQPAAKVRGLAGGAQVRSGDAEPAPASKGQLLFVGDVAITHDDGAMLLAFPGGNELELEPNTTVELRADGAAMSKVGAIVLDGEVKIRSTGGGETLRVGLPFEDRVLEVGAGPVEILVGEESVEVLVGSIEVVGQDGERAEVGAGEVLQIGGVVVEVGQENEEDEVVELEAIEITLLANPRFVRVKRAGEDSWSRPKKTDSLNAGDTVRTRRSGAIMAFDDETRVRLDGDSELTIEDASRSDDETRARYSLGSGAATIKLSRRDEGRSEHTILIGDTPVSLEPGAREADIEVRRGNGNEARVAVRLGRATLPDGTVIGPGQTVGLEGGKASGELRELTATNVQLRTGMSSVVYYSSSRPAVVFTWKPEEGAERYEVELSRNKGFDGAPVFREELDRTRFVYEQLDEGAFFWRVRAKGSGDEGWSKGVFRVKRGNPSRCGKNCGRENKVRDTGVKTVVYFQQALPSITLEWEAVAGVSTYRLKVFRDGEFEQPFVDQTLKVTQRKFRAGQFEEGKYFWLVNALGPGGEELRTGGTNGLEIRFDNSTTGIQIAAPATNQRIRKSRVLTAGEVPLGQSLYINGQRAKLDANGRFREYVSLNYKGRHSIVYRTMASDGVERYYVRDVFRK